MLYVMYLLTFVHVLIDTWWNVNKDILTREEFGHWGFNRYMVECECVSVSDRKHTSRGFNRYMVECEFEEWEFLEKKAKGFNRYMVECEFGHWEMDTVKGKRFNRYMVECE